MRKIIHSLGLGLLLIIAPKLALGSEIAVTLPPLAGLVAMLDSKAEPFCLLAPGTDPHHFQLQPRTIESLRQSRLLIRALRDDQSWPLPPEHANSLALWPNTDHGWLSPAAVREALPQIAEVLIALHPERGDAIRMALAEALAQADAVAAAWREALAPLRRSGVIMQHPAWQRLMQEMEVPVLTVLESGAHGHEHGPHLLEDALADLNRHPEAWLLGNEGHSQRSLEWLANHATSAPRRVTLDPLGSCGVPWPEFMRSNLERISP